MEPIRGRFGAVDGYRLNSGRELTHVNVGILGVSADWPRRCYSGYDDMVSESFDEPGVQHHEDFPVFTDAERVEIADYMIALWTQFKAPKAST